MLRAAVVGPLPVTGAANTGFASRPTAGTALVIVPGASALGSTPWLRSVNADTVACRTMRSHIPHKGKNAASRRRSHQVARSITFFVFLPPRGALVVFERFFKKTVYFLIILLKEIYI